MDVMQVATAVAILMVFGTYCWVVIKAANQD